MRGDAIVWNNIRRIMHLPFSRLSFPTTLGISKKLQTGSKWCFVEWHFGLHTVNDCHVLSFGTWLLSKIYCGSHGKQRKLLKEWRIMRAAREKNHSVYVVLFPTYSSRLLTSMIGNLNGAKRRSQQKAVILAQTHTDTHTHTQLYVHICHITNKHNIHAYTELHKNVHAHT